MDITIQAELTAWHESTTGTASSSIHNALIKLYSATNKPATTQN